MSATLSNDDVLKRVFWVKLVVAVLAGLVCGLVGFVGATTIIGFGAVATGVSFAYVTKYLELDEEDIGRWELIQEGWPAFPTFLLVWITFYNAF